jgi:hypothetical protein
MRGDDQQQFGAVSYLVAVPDARRRGGRMPGWYMHMDVARKALGNLSASPSAGAIFGANGQSAAQLSDIAINNPAYVALGAIGPDIFFLLPDFKPPVGTMLFGAANTIREIYT